MEHGLTHFDNTGNAVMVDVTDKDITSRTAIAEGYITLSAAAFNAVQNGTAAKGDVLGVARIAGIMAAKRTSELIPLCHPLPLGKCTIDFTPHEDTLRVYARCTVKVGGKTGVEMEALTGASTALLTIYDMCKAIDKSMGIGGIRLLHKSGGKSGTYDAGEAGWA